MKSFRSKVFRDFASGAVEKCLPADTGDMGSVPGLGRFHVPGSSCSPAATATEPRLCGQRSRCNGAPLTAAEQTPPGTTGESPRAAGDPVQPKQTGEQIKSQLLRRKATVSRCPVPWR